MKKLASLSLKMIFALILSVSALTLFNTKNVSASELSNEQYWAYSQSARAGVYLSPITVNDNGKEVMAYCFNASKALPASAPGNVYRKITNATNSDMVNYAGFSNATKVNILRTIYNGYPYDKHNLQTKYGLTGLQFRAVTQAAIWAYTDGYSYNTAVHYLTYRDGVFYTSFTQNMKNAYDELTSNVDRLTSVPSNFELDLFISNESYIQNLLAVRFTEDGKEVKDITISTKATAENNAKEVEENTNTTINDTVTLKGLEIGKNYTLKGVMMVKETHSALTLNGIEVTGETTFNATTENMEVKVSFNVNTTNLGNKSLVVFEELYDGNKVVASHKDINDAGQTVKVKVKPYDNPNGKIGTTVSVNSKASSASKAVEVTEKDAKKGVKVVDTISYEGLVKGEKYNVSGILYEVENGKVKKEIASAKATYIATDSQGTWDVDFGLVKLEAGKTYVVFEKAVSVNNLIDSDNDNKADKKQEVSHEDANDKAQTVTVEDHYDNPNGKIGTTVSANNQKSTSSKATIVKDVNSVKVVDNISYEGLVKGEKYTVTGVLYEVENGKVTNVIATKTEVLEASNNKGTWDIDFGEVKLEAGKKYVVFEKAISVNNLIDTDGDNKPDSKQEVSHEDANDEAQSITTEKPTTPTPPTPNKPTTPTQGKVVKTGDTTNMIASIMMVSMSLALMLVLAIKMFINKEVY